MFTSGTGDEPEASKSSNAKWQAKIGTVRKVALLKNKWSPC